jgi:hypothetical protein
MAVKWTNTFNCYALQNLPKKGFLVLESIPSGNPGFGDKKTFNTFSIFS